MSEAIDQDANTPRDEDQYAARQDYEGQSPVGFVFGQKGAKGLLRLGQLAEAVLISRTARLTCQVLLLCLQAVESASVLSEVPRGVREAE